MDRSATGQILLLLLAVTTTWSILAPGKEKTGSLRLCKTALLFLSVLTQLYHLLYLINFGESVDGVTDVLSAI